MYKEKQYTDYVSTHTSHLYGEVTINKIKSMFPVWKWYYGRCLPLDKSAKILDLGCGNGSYLYFLRSLGYENSTGIDISREQIDIARRLDINGIECNDIVSYLRDKNEDYDLIFARDVLEHLTKSEIPEALKAIYEAIKVKGLFVIQVPNGECVFSGRMRYGDFTHELAFTKNSLRQVLRQTGFSEVAFYQTGPVPHGLKSAVRFILWKLFEVILGFYMLVETGTSEGIYTQNIIAVARKT